ncbi:helix-turn-helix domain-containing protein [Nocardia sp. NPDC058666]|uniref:MmyB family transcriptional regulator n=1 Tax=unclassified Nocardia TaxID=2637762 RepID=UPI00365D80FF
MHPKTGEGIHSRSMSTIYIYTGVIMPYSQFALPLPSIGDYFRWARERAGMTRQALSDRTNVAYGTIRKIESGEQKRVGDSVLRPLITTLNLTSAAQLRYIDELNRVEIRRFWIADGVRADLCDAERAQLTALTHVAAAYLNERWDIIGANDAYEALFPGIRAAGNVMRWLFSETGRRIVIGWEDEAAETVALTRGLMAHFGNPEWGRRLVSELQHDSDFRRLWMGREIAYDRTADSPIHIWTPSGPVTVVMQFRPVTQRPDLLHLALAFPQPYVGSALR